MSTFTQLQQLGATPLQAGFFSRLLESGTPLAAIKVAIDRAEAFDTAAGAELRAGWHKLAGHATGLEKEAFAILKNLPQWAKYLGVGAGGAAGAGIPIYMATQSAISEGRDELQKAIANANPLGGIMDWVKNKDNLPLVLALLASTGIGVGGLAGGSQGAALGGIGAPLLFYLLQQSGAFDSSPAKPAAEPPVAGAGAAADAPGAGAGAGAGAAAPGAGAPGAPGAGAPGAPGAGAPGAPGAGAPGAPGALGAPGAGAGGAGARAGGAGAAVPAAPVVPVAPVTPAAPAAPAAPVTPVTPVGATSKVAPPARAGARVAVRTPQPKTNLVGIGQPRVPRATV